MADPISIAGLIIQLISTAKQAYDFGTSIKNAREDIQDLFGELFALKAIVEQIRTDDEPFPNDKRYMIPENGPFNNTWLYTRDLLTEILDDLVNRASRGQSSLNHIGWPGKKSELREKITRLERLKTYFILVLMNDQAEMDKATLLSIDALASATVEIKQNSDRDLNRKIKHWLCPIDLESMHRRASSACQAGTGLWFIDKHLEEWISGRHQSRFLYLEGKSGSGKTVLCSAAIEKTKSTIQESKSTQILYFYCSFRSANSQQPDYFLGSLLSQLSSTFPAILGDLRDAFERRVLPSTDALIDLVCHNLVHLEKTILFVDAVNESAESGAFFSILSTLVNSIPNFFIMVTSTTPPPALYSEKGLFKVRMQSNSNKDDIHAFIYEQLQSQPTLRRLSPDAKNQITATLTKKADGMFRYVQCQIDLLSAQRTGRDVIRALEKIPEGLNGTYELILGSISPSDRVLAREALVWLTYSCQPMRLAALNEAVVIHRGDELLDDECKLCDKKAILYICQGLVSYDEKTTIITLAHSSVQAYLTSDLIKHGCAAFFSIDETEATRNIFEKCLTYLGFKGFDHPCQHKPTLNQRLSENPLYRYAAENWALHCSALQSLGSGLTEADLNSVMRLFSTRQKPDGGNYTSWTQVILFEAPARRAQTTLPLYYAASYGLLPVVDRLLKSEANCNTHGGRNEATPLIVAAFRGHLPVVERLLKAGADPTRKDRFGMTSLEWALENRRHDIAKILVDYSSK